MGKQGIKVKDPIKALCWKASTREDDIQIREFYNYEAMIKWAKDTFDKWIIDFEPHHSNRFIEQYGNYDVELMQYDDYIE